MQTRTIRAWHYTRLTDQEAQALKRDGIHVSTPETLTARLEALVTTGHLSRRAAEALYEASPFHGDQRKSREGKFWMISHPQAIDDGGVEPLLARWGGEVASFWLKDELLLATVSVMGPPCVIEVAVPLALTSHSYSAAEAVMAAFGREARLHSRGAQFRSIYNFSIAAGCSSVHPQRR